MEFDINLITVVSSALAGLLAYFAALYKTHLEKQKHKVDELKSFGEANRLFRDEIRCDLKKANSRISELERLLIEKDEHIAQLHTQISSLHNKIEQLKDIKN